MVMLMRMASSSAISDVVGVLLGERPTAGALAVVSPEPAEAQPVKTTMVMNAIKAALPGAVVTVVQTVSRTLVAVRWSMAW
jgi:hypothetical protein